MPSLFSSVRCGSIEILRKAATVIEGVKEGWLEGFTFLKPVTNTSRLQNFSGRLRLFISTSCYNKMTPYIFLTSSLIAQTKQ